jgi:hypothetical protein
MYVCRSEVSVSCRGKGQVRLTHVCMYVCMYVCMFEEARSACLADAKAR